MTLQERVRMFRELLTEAHDSAGADGFIEAQDQIFKILVHNPEKGLLAKGENGLQNRVWAVGEVFRVLQVVDDLKEASSTRGGLLLAIDNLIIREEN